MADTGSTIFLGRCLVGAGIVTALFWLSTAPFETFAGAEVASHVLFVPGQVLHVAGALLTIFGYIGLFQLIRPEAGRFSLSAFVLAVLGAAFFFGDGIIALVVFPMLAQHAPELIEATGPLFTGRVLGFFVLFAATNMIGTVLFGAAAMLSRLVPWAACLLLIAGGVLANLPPLPGMHLVLVTGGVLWGAGAIWLGYAVVQKARADSLSLSS